MSESNRPDNNLLIVGKSVTSEQGSVATGGSVVLNERDERASGCREVFTVNPGKPEYCEVSNSYADGDHSPTPLVQL